MREKDRDKEEGERERKILREREKERGRFFEKERDRDKEKGEKEWEEGNLSKPKHVKQGLIPLVMHSWYNLADAWQKHLLFVFLVLVLHC